MSVALSWGSSSGWLRVCRERLTFGEYVTCQALEGHSRQSPAALKGREGPPKSAPQYEAGKGEGSFCLSGTPPPRSQCSRCLLNHLTEVSRSDPVRTEQRSHRPFLQWEAPPGRVPAMNLLTNSLTSHPRSGGKVPNLGLRSVGRGTNERMYKMPDTQFVSPTLCCPFLLGSSLFWRVLGPGTQEEEASQRPKPPMPERYKTLGGPF